MIKTKQELLNHFSDINTVYNNPFMYQTLSNMIDELLEQQPCDDCISRKETIEWLKKVTVTDGITFKTGFEQIIYDIEQMPSVTPSYNSVKTELKSCDNCISRPKGTWDILSDDDGIYGICSVCQQDADFVHYGVAFDFCPNCGADMRGEDDDE